ncbi:MAG TPA: bacillithiol biosynthesis deacetylase BshB1 [Candidatus Hydrogenedentes bacterium]|nr:bacillithiol biosynthesis deacetylase BshB1 [Candidatus Hydrogenedentota bacterium]HIJ74583.1 bacillithiol biosynthesis deacetylase BshB1 [Candidatus Hydrogenedentota bacterium]
MSVDVVAVGAHPDDVELGIGGLVCKLAQRGRRVGILDLSRGEMSTRGSVDERVEEAAEAARILGVTRRDNAELPDGTLANTDDQRRRVIQWIRTLRPQMLLVPMEGDRHPDHGAAYHLVRDANYFSGLVQIDTGQRPHRTPWVYYYHPYYDGATSPQILIDVSEQFETKLAALKAHKSQFYNPEYPGEATLISSEAFWDSIRVRAAYWGTRIHAAYGEPLHAEGPIGLEFPPGLEPRP